MKIKCPECDTLYDVSEEIANSGAQVQCANCSAVFAATPFKAAPSGELLPENAKSEPPRNKAEAEAETETETETDSKTETGQNKEELPPALSENADDFLSDEEKEFFAAFSADLKGDNIISDPATSEPEAEASTDEDAMPEQEEEKEETEEESDIGWADETDMAGKNLQASDNDASLDAFDAPEEADSGTDLVDDDLFAATPAEPFAPSDAGPEPEPEPQPPRAPGGPNKPAAKASIFRSGKEFDKKILAGWGALAVCITLIFAGAAMFRVPISQAIPGMAGLYEKVGLPVNIRGLEFHGISHQWINEAGQAKLVVRGEIVNITGKEVAVPEMVFIIVDHKGLAFFQWTEQAMVDRLKTGARVRFRVQIPAPADRVRQVKIRFARKG